ncbi:immunoglobulin superfamily DCC subclass member 3-like isoform X1 [Mytilus californianus]|uniref:immunoglobulin superfamily DCC subclass member 3-like isoform X1 n=1 Tax=Mytilus californianus TaxID=6549 RepID=UPI002247ED35|nr:immunoglobulin superfamily DCC subclass member 3-like isoform X1 [Mytilus californianus]XP_052101873.1 immunoglobulin superfamily DCC subclass member 3-like isoform X1 [Mytilus californianus]XP_052101874.1 immunoglobulin superfamily DCC subclass member 3-like isoform X1 [Mytilus californianus]XP_052101875.1 immunoglobulin superfamily DCC subclass member 3-like isoform X1 [Mytilus californianus]XP_052101876.1 immunoglobulin superfamily DCC subclass member 3-like isoform X1 [Mytilus california
MKKRVEYKSWIKNYLLSILFTFVFSVSAAGWNGYILPSFKETRTNITVYVGKTAVLPCSIVNLGTKKVIWKRVDQKHALTIGEFVFTTDERHSVDHTDKGYKWNLVIKDVTKAHAGLYDCQISTKEDLVRRIRLYVTDPPPVEETKEKKTIFRPAIHISGPNFTEKGEPIRITCNATSDSLTPEHMDWFHNGLKLQQNIDAGILITEYRHSETKTLYSVLEIAKSTMKDTGVYICRSSKKDVDSHHVVVLNADSSHDKRGFQDKKTVVKSSHMENPGNSASSVNRRVHYLMSNCLLILVTILAHNR